MRDLLDFLYLKGVVVEISLALTPLLICFAILQVLLLKLPWEYVRNLLQGVFLTFLGLVLFLQGVKVGFMPTGTLMGEMLGSLHHNWILIPIGFGLGLASTIAEPAVRVLAYEVEKTSAGSIKAKMILFTLSLGVAFIVALGMAKIVYGIPVHYIIVPGYLIALVMLKFSDPTFISIAFDAGAAATGPMVATFIVSMTVGVATVMEGRDPVLDGFGLIALVTMAPVLSIMALGLLYSIKKRK
jgi:hypothetical protein